MLRVLTSWVACTCTAGSSVVQQPVGTPSAEPLQTSVGRLSGGMQLSWVCPHSEAVAGLMLKLGFVVVGRCCKCSSGICAAAAAAAALFSNGWVSVHDPPLPPQAPTVQSFWYGSAWWLLHDPVGLSVASCLQQFQHMLRSTNVPEVVASLPVWS